MNKVRRYQRETCFAEVEKGLDERGRRRLKNIETRCVHMRK